MPDEIEMIKKVNKANDIADKLKKNCKFDLALIPQPNGNTKASSFNLIMKRMYAYCLHVRGYYRVMS